MPYILLDALHINNGGGKILLDYLIEKLEDSDLYIYYLLDVRVINNIQPIKKGNKVHYESASYFNRLKFYNNKKRIFELVLCFGNIPPLIRLKVPVYTYFHNPMYLDVPLDFSNFQKILYYIKTFILTNSVNYTDKFIVQSAFIKKRLQLKFKIDSDKVLVLPFYPPLISEIQINRDKNSFLFVSNATPNKNHEKLINAFCKFYDIYKCATLTLTVNPSFNQTFNLIEEKKRMGYPIKNIGFVKREELKAYYAKSEYLIFPSLAESFGLGIVEAIENGCKVIGSNLPYLFEVCKPSLVFNPLSEEDIFNAIKSSCFNILDKSQNLIKNNINELIKLMRNGY